MSYARVITYEYKPNTLNPMVPKVKNGLIPLFQKTPGFLSYCTIREKGDQGVSVGIWQTREQAEAATQQAAKWLEDTAKDVTIRRDTYVGEVLIDFDASAVNRAVIEAIYDAFNKKDLSRATSLIEPGAKVTNVGFGNIEQPLQDYFQNWATAFPDGQITIDRFICSEDGVVCEYTGRGTHTGTLKTPMGTIPPTNKHAEGSFVEIYRFRNGKVADSHVYFDAMNLLRQLGLGPEMKLSAGKPEARKPEARI